ncbi:MAG: hypothetical protein HY553_08265 [Elusimicrobia bacterium]|nr:hypothetical protein [Elusimicrobiota bacterium]
MTGRKDEKERKGGGIVFPFGGMSADGFLRWLLTAPEAWLARIGAAAALSLNLAWLAAAVAMPPAPAKGAQLPGFAARPSLDMRDTLFSPRSMITGFKTILAPDFAASEGAPERGAPAGGAASAESPLPDVGSNLARPGEGGEGEAGGEKGRKEGGEGKPGEGAEAAALDAAAAGGRGGSGASMGGLAGLRGPGTSGASSSASMPAGVTGGSLSRARQALLPGRKTIARAPARSRGALGQLKFAKNMSNQGKLAPSSERSYEAASTAFQGQTAQPGGIPAVGGVPVGAPAPQDTPGEGGPTFGRAPPTCPAGYTFDGSDCLPPPTKDVTPYKNLVELARKFLIAAAILGALGLFMLMKGGPSGQLLGGLLLGAALALALAAMAIGNTIKQDYDQTPQKEAIDRQAQKPFKSR